jgi:hypothetical protein
MELLLICRRGVFCREDVGGGRYHGTDDGAPGQGVTGGAARDLRVPAQEPPATSFWQAEPTTGATLRTSRHCGRWATGVVRGLAAARGSRPSGDLFSPNEIKSGSPGTSRTLLALRPSTGHLVLLLDSRESLPPGPAMDGRGAVP